MVLSTYEAAVECRGTFAPRSSCATIIDDMEKSQRSETFGPKADPPHQVTLPVVLKSSTSPLSPLKDLASIYTGGCRGR